jgi:hypothetical protein
VTIPDGPTRGILGRGSPHGYAVPVVDGRGEAIGASGATSGQTLGGSPFDTPPPADDWPRRLTDTIVGYVQKVRAATTGRALVASRAVVYVLAIALIAIVALVLGIILVFRLLTEIAQGRTWLVYLVVGALLTVAGVFAWAKKERTASAVR